MVCAPLTGPFPKKVETPRFNMERKKTDKEKSHKGIWRSDAPEASQGQTRDVPGTPGTFGPDSVPPKFFMFIGFFSFPI